MSDPLLCRPEADVARSPAAANRCIQSSGHNHRTQHAFDQFRIEQVRGAFGAVVGRGRGRGRGRARLSDGSGGEAVNLSQMFVASGWLVRRRVRLCGEGVEGALVGGGGGLEGSVVGVGELGEAGGQESVVDRVRKWGVQAVVGDLVAVAVRDAFDQAVVRSRRRS